MTIIDTMDYTHNHAQHSIRAMQSCDLTSTARSLGQGQGSEPRPSYWLVNEKRSTINQYTPTQRMACTILTQLHAHIITVHRRSSDNKQLAIEYKASKPEVPRIASSWLANWLSTHRLQCGYILTNKCVKTRPTQLQLSVYNTRYCKQHKN